MDERRLDEDDLAARWPAQFELWLADARAAGFAEPQAMVLSTADARGRPSSRTVLLKAVDERGFTFFTNLDSRKGRELAENPQASLLLGWYALGRQVAVVGDAIPVADADADAYFASRPYGSRISAAVSRQSEVIASRAILEERRAELEARHPPPGPVPRPERWSGFRVVPESVEFWQHREHRLHDRLRFRRLSGEVWILERLSP